MKIKEYPNIAYIYQPHFMTNKFRVSVNNQRGKEFNYIVVTCSPEFNGVWKYPAENIIEYKIWMNRKTPCYCVPIEDCTFVQKLEEIKKDELKKAAISQQEAWFKNEVKNTEHKYVNRPKWMLKQ